jgi:eukaryotic-like serine/threonine-protein kinase
LDAKSSSPKAYQLEIASIQNELGRMYQVQRQFDAARQCHQAALQILQSAAGDAPLQIRYELARTYYLLGVRERPLPDFNPPGRSPPPPPPADAPPDEQRDFLTKAVTLLEELAQQRPAEPQYQHLLALCYLEGAPLAEPNGAGARAGAERAIEILEGLVKALPDVPDYAYDLSEAYARMHVPRPPIPLDRQQLVEQHFQKAAALLDKLVARHPNIPEYLTAQAHTHHKLGAFFRQIERWGEAEESLRKALAIQSSLVEQFPDAPYHRVWLGTFRIALGDVLIRSRQLPEARSSLEEAIAGLTRLLTDQPEMTFLHGPLARGYSTLAVALRQSGRREAAAQAEQQAQRERGLLSPEH